MYKIPVSLLVVLVSLYSGAAKATDADSNGADTAELARLASDAGHAYAARDLATLERITADDYVQIDCPRRIVGSGSMVEFR